MIRIKVHLINQSTQMCITGYKFCQQKEIIDKYIFEFTTR